MTWTALLIATGLLHLRELWPPMGRMTTATTTDYEEDPQATAVGPWPVRPVGAAVASEGGDVWTNISTPQGIRIHRLEHCRGLRQIYRGRMTFTSSTWPTVLLVK